MQSMSNIRLDTIDIGSIVQYLLLPSEQPTDPNKLWKGRVDRVIRSTSTGRISMCRILSLESGYEGMEEYIYFDQIRAI